MEKALKKLDSILASEAVSWQIERKFWKNCFECLQQMPNSSRIIDRIANASKETINDYLTEAWYAVFFAKLGFQVVIEPFGKAGPDMEISHGSQSSIVEVTRFRKVYEGPPEFSVQDIRFEIAEYGDSRRDTEKTYNKIVGKFRQINNTTLATSIIVIWNDDGELEEIEMRNAVRHLRQDSDRNKVPLPASLAFVVFGPWDGRFWCFKIRSRLYSYEEEWQQKIESMSVGMFKDRVLNPELKG